MIESLVMLIIVSQGLDLNTQQAGLVKVTLEGSIAVRKKVKNPPPAYPEGAIKDSVEGQVKIWLVVSKAGRVTRARVDSSSGKKILDKAALAAVKSWVFARAQVVDTGYATFKYTLGPDLPQASQIKTGGLEAAPPTIDISEKPTQAVAITKITTKIRKKPSVEIKSKTKASYPEKAKEARESGTVTVRVYLKPKGEIDRVEVVSSSGSDALDEAAVSCVKSWTFYTKAEGMVEVDFIYELK